MTFKVITRAVPVSEEEGLSSPLDGDALADGDVVQVNLDLGQGQNVPGGGHAEKQDGGLHHSRKDHR